MQDEQTSQERKITVSFRKSSDYKIISPTDLFGGATPDLSKLFFHLTIDHTATPNYQTFSVNEQGMVNLSKLESISAGDLEKELLCGVLLSPEDAIKIGTWLVQSGNDLISRKKGQ